MESGIDPRWGEQSPLHDPNMLAHFNARPTDVLITTAPKAGTTWMQQILHQLKTGGDPGFADIDQVVPWLELPRRGMSWRELLDKYEQLSDPRIFKTHCTFPQTPGTGTARICKGQDHLTSILKAGCLLAHGIAMYKAGGHILMTKTFCGCVTRIWSTTWRPVCKKYCPFSTGNSQKTSYRKYWNIAHSRG